MSASFIARHVYSRRDKNMKIKFIFTVHKVFRNEEKYYEMLIEKSIGTYNLFPYHLSDVITKGLRVTAFNYYLEVISHLLKLDKSYDTLPNFTAADILRVLGIGRNEYLL